MVAIEDIPAGAEITVAYDKTGYYDSSTRCLCKSCRSERGEASPRDLSVLNPGNRGREAEGAKGGGKSQYINPSRPANDSPLL
jgi:hypothetical protein